LNQPDSMYLCPRDKATGDVGYAIGHNIFTITMKSLCGSAGVED